MTLDEVADELYGLPPGEFVATRNARAKEAKAAGDKELAAGITGLAKPTKVAWLANQLVRQRRDDVQPLMELGAGLREATASLSGEDLRRLTKQQHQLVHALVQQARALAGGPVTEDVADGVDRTLRAALADSALADELLRGRLTEGLEFSGFGGAPAAAAETAPRPNLRVVKPATRRDDAEAKAAARRQAIDLAEQSLAAARTAVSAAESARDAATAAVTEAESGLGDVEQRIERLHAELDQAKTDKEAADKELRGVRNAAEVAERAVRGAGRRAAAAEADLAALQAQA